MPERRPRADRAQQFMPFAALKGYYDLIRERERVVEPKRELTDEQALELSRKLSQLKRREMACIVHYDGEAYVTARGPHRHRRPHPHPLRRHRGHPDGRVTHHRPKNTLEGRFACFSGDDACATVCQRYLPVTLSGLSATCSGVPTATMRPPEAPPPGPRSTT